MRARSGWARALGACALAFSGCGAADPPGSSCIESLAADCTPVAFSPTYDAIFDNVLSGSCGAASTGGSCHYGPMGAASAKAGLWLKDPDTAYASLLGMADGRARVLPRDPACSILEERLESSDPNFRMPVGSSPLPEPVRCAIRQWIANGAAR